MRVGVRNLLLVNSLWLVGIAVLVVGLVAGPLSSIGTLREEVRELQDAVVEQDRMVQGLQSSAQLLGHLDALDDVLGDSERMAGSQAVRIAELSAAARAAGVTIVALESLSPRPVREGHVDACEHRLVGLGDFRELAAFLQGVADMPGVKAIDGLELEPRDDRAEGSTLRVSFLVTWFAARPEALVPTGEEAG